MKKKDDHFSIAEINFIAAENMRQVGTTEDHRKIAYDAYTSAAQDGHLDALWRLGQCAFDGFGTPACLVTAFKTLSQASLQGHAGAKEDLIAFYALGDKIADTRQETLQLLQTAATQGVTTAFGLLANIHLRYSSPPNVTLGCQAYIVAHIFKATMDEPLKKLARDYLETMPKAEKDAITVTTTPIITNLRRLQDHLTKR